MQRKKIFPLFFLFLLLSVLITSFTDSVLASSNNVKNAGFEEDLTYWTSEGAIVLSDAGVYSGVKYVELEYQTGWVKQNVGNVSTSSIYGFGFYAKKANSGSVWCTVTYNDTTYDIVLSGYGLNLTWSYVNIGINGLDYGKYIQFITITRTAGASGSIYIDNVYLGSSYSESGDGEGEGYDIWYSNMVVTYMVFFIFIIVPPLIIAFEFAKHDVDPFMGFIGGLCLTVPIAYIVDIIDLWVLFVFVLGLILMIMAKLGAFSRG